MYTMYKALYIYIYRQFSMKETKTPFSYYIAFLPCVYSPKLTRDRRLSCKISRIYQTHPNIGEDKFSGQLLQDRYYYAITLSILSTLIIGIYYLLANMYSVKILPMTRLLHNGNMGIFKSFLSRKYQMFTLKTAYSNVKI